MVARWLVLASAIALGASSSAIAQTSARTYRVGWLGYTAYNTAEDERNVAAFRERLRELGFAEGQNLVIEWRYAEGHDERYRDFAAELVRLHADAVVVGSGTAARAVMEASRTMPIVSLAVPDPVRSGLVASLAHPGGQLTGMTNLPDELVPKRLELVRVALPSAKRVALIRCPRCLLSSGASGDDLAKVARENADAARRLGFELQPIDVNDVADFDRAASLLRKDPPDAILIGATQINSALKREWLALASELRRPTLAPYRAFGGTLTYGPELAAWMRRVAEYVARVLRGASPGDLPMEQPTVFELVVDAKSAREIGFEILPALRLRADLVVE